ncbi:RNA 2',3'-cyclic phosphodiesterase [Maricaulaceae bacterium NA33B04]|nr:RNA 2',3'-cyclic phosphodiesterase [Maricaulaceae bacterium NA33B04]
MSLRVFTALPVPDLVADQAMELMDQVPGANWRPRENLHITLAFYGEQTEPVIRDLDAGLACITAPPMQLRFSGVGRSNRKDGAALWAIVEPNAALNQLARDCRKAARGAGIEMESRHYLAHMTLAYLGSGVDPVRLQRFEQRHSLFKSDIFAPDRFYMYSSRPRKPGKPNSYEIEAEYPL